MKTSGSFVGRIISEKWHILRHLGAGGVGAVYEGVQLSSNKRCAIKVLHAQHEIKESILERFYQELLILRRLRHPGIVEVYEFGFEESLGFYLVMEYLEGCSLSDLLANSYEDIPFDVIYKWFVQICDAMEYSHQKGVIHRDLKPDHVFFMGGPQKQDFIKIIDFGIAKFEMGENPNLTQSGTTLGTPRYLAPEQAMGHPIDHRADIYALSVILFELVTRRSVFTAESSLQYMMHHAYTTPPTISIARKDRKFPKALEDLVASGLSKISTERPESMIVFRDRLFDALQEVLHTGEFASLPDANTGKSADRSTYQISRQQLSFSVPATKIKIGGHTETFGENIHSTEGPAHEQKTGRFKRRAVKFQTTQSWINHFLSPQRRWMVGILGGMVLLLVVGLVVAALWTENTPDKTEIPSVSKQRRGILLVKPNKTRQIIHQEPDVSREQRFSEPQEIPEREPTEEPASVVSEEDDSDTADKKVAPQSKDEWLKLIRQKLEKQERDKKNRKRWLDVIQKKLKEQEKPEGREPARTPAIPEKRTPPPALREKPKNPNNP